MPSNRNQKKIENQKKIFEFFVEHLESKQPFTRQELEQITTWHGKSFDTYWSKQFRSFIKEVRAKPEPRLYRVSEAFRRIATWKKFREYVTQVRGVAPTEYQPLKYDLVRIYEFFMPLTNEAYLRAALDALFYRDTIESLLRTIDAPTLQDAFPRTENESEADYIDRLCDWLSRKFVGYSVYHVNGRFRVQSLATRADAGNSTSRYLVDETTAVTRFIFPCESETEASQIEFFFTNLFVKAIIEVVNGEDEIWMVETGMRNRLHIWRVVSS